jgi:hypothetical protein
MVDVDRVAGPDTSVGARIQPFRSAGTGARVKREYGSVTVEAVLVIPVIMVVLLAVVQFALWAHAAQLAQLAASEGDRVARSLGGGSAAGMVQANSVLSGPGSDVAAPVVVVDIMPGDLIRVSVTGRATSVFPGLSLPVSAVRVGPIQEFRGEALEFGNSEAHRGSNPSVVARFEALWSTRVPRPEGYGVIPR